MGFNSVFKGLSPKQDEKKIIKVKKWKREEGLV
jgi:hypothetical protein